MENEVWYDHFIKILFEKYPKRMELAQVLADLLHIENEAVYRRLRKEVSFSVHEVAKISLAWNISLDSIIGIGKEKIPFLMQPINYIIPSKQELKYLQCIIQSINSLKDFTDTEFMDVCNKLPRQFLAGYNYLNQFYLFKWLYEYGNEKQSVPFSKVVISEEQRRLTADYYKAIKNVPNTSFIFDHRLFDNLVCEILYFHSIQMITDSEKEFIKKDLNALLDYLLETATNGCYPETQNKVTLYISQFNINTNYSYTCTRQINVCFVHVFEKHEIYTYDVEIINKFKLWMQLKKNSSVQISEIDKRSRIEYFIKQRQIVDML